MAIIQDAQSKFFLGWMSYKILNKHCPKHQYDFMTAKRIYNELYNFASIYQIKTICYKFSKAGIAEGSHLGYELTTFGRKATAYDIIDAICTNSYERNLLLALSMEPKNIEPEVAAKKLNRRRRK